MTFSRARLVAKFIYIINSVILFRSMEPIKDLGILFDSKLKFDCHINYILNRSHKILGFINRNCFDFTDKFALKSLVCSICCEYSSVIWSSYQSSHKSKLKKVLEKRFAFPFF